MGVDRDIGAPWPESACRSDLLNFTGTFDPVLGQPFPLPDGVVGSPDGSDIGFERPSPGSDDMLATPSVFGDVDPESRKIFGRVFVIQMVFRKGCVQTASKSNESRSAVDNECNHCISRKLRRNNGMQVMTLVDHASGICLQLCRPGLSFGVYIVCKLYIVGDKLGI